MNLDKREEDLLVILQFTDIDEANYCQQFSQNFKTIEIESKTPIVQIGNRFYKGEYINNIGTYLFFEQLSLKGDKAALTQNITNNLSNTNSNIKAEYSGKSFKKLLLSRLFIEEKEQSDQTADLE